MSETPETEIREQLRRLPSIDELLARQEVSAWVERWGRPLVADALREAVQEAREAILAGCERGEWLCDALARQAGGKLVRLLQGSLRKVINATGVVLHTGLGRAPLSPAALRAIEQTASGYCNLEFDLETGERGRRTDHVADLLRRVTGAEAATVVNNNAAATLLVLNAIADQREVIVSRGQLIEIGGSFRLPEIFAKSGAILREVGTTNRTRPGDYEAAITDRTAALMHVHTSNYRVMGFAESASIGELAGIAHRRGLAAIDDLGSGALFDLSPWGLPDEPSARASVAAGADVICFSGDKLLGGPQMGVVAGRKDLIQRMNANPLARAFRIDKLCLAAMQATLIEWLTGQSGQGPSAGIPRTVPTAAMLTLPPEVIRKRASDLQSQLQRALPQEEFTLVEDVSQAGGGSLPTAELATWTVRWSPKRMSASVAAGRLRRCDPSPVVARIHAGAIVFDLRTVDPNEIPALVAACVSAMALDYNPASLRD